MPTYEYACAACGHHFEEFQSIKAKPTVKCPACGQRKVKRLISAGAGFIFKGSGFYTTDYRSDKYKADAKSDAPAAKTDAKGDGKSDAPAKADAPKSESPKNEAPRGEPPRTQSAPAKSESKSAATSESKPAAKSIK